MIVNQYSVFFTAKEKDRNVKDSGVVGIVELWVTLFARRGKAVPVPFRLHFRIFQQFCRVNPVTVKDFIGLDGSGAAAQTLFHVKGVLRICVGSTLAFRVLCYVEFVRKKQAYPA